MGTTDWVVALKIDPTVIELYFTDNSSTADNVLTAGSGLGRSPGEPVGRQEGSV